MNQALLFILCVCVFVHLNLVMIKCCHNSLLLQWESCRLTHHRGLWKFAMSASLSPKEIVTNMVPYYKCGTVVFNPNTQRQSKNYFFPRPSLYPALCCEHLPQVTVDKAVQEITSNHVR